MRKVILVLITVLLAYAATAQYVSITDPGFKNELRIKYPASFNAAGLLDTTSNEILTEDTLVIFGPTNLEGLQYFKSLTFLSCGSNSAEAGSIPSFPASLKTLEISQFYYLTELPALPPLLQHITCTQTRVSVLPALPDSLEFLNCMGNRINHIPSFPAGLKFLYCGENPLSILPEFPDSLIEADFSNSFVFPDAAIANVPALPAGLKKLICANQQITSLPVLPEGLQELNCSNNRLTALPLLPNSLKKLACNNMPLGILPALPDSLLSLSCVNDSLGSLPPLPPDLIYLYCSNNHLTDLPPFPGSIRWLDCSGNNIYCLPLLPAKVNSPRPPESGNNHFIVVDADKITCVPNNTGHVVLAYVNNNPTAIRSFCNPTNNANHCQVFPVISGRVFYDNNGNGLRDTNENYKPNVKFALPNGRIAYSDRNGYFEIGADSIGIYSISATAPNYYNIIPSSATYNFTNYDTLVFKEYALQANTIQDSLTIKVTSINNAARPGFSFPYMINYENTGTTTLSPTIVFDYDQSRLDYNTSSVAGVMDNTNTLAFIPGSMSPGESGSFIGYFTLKTTVPLGDTLNAKAVINAGTFTAFDSVRTTVIGAYDPNDKQATPQLSPSQVANAEYIDYTIRFQNTGTDTAFTVVISDTLSADLQVNSLQMIASSHNCKATVKDNVIFFEFLNILLPDSNINEPLSHGFVSFKIKPQTTVAVNTTIPNKAAIYFDYNAPVITNTAGTLIKDLIVLPLRLISFNAMPQNDNTTSLYWNTSNELSTKHFVIEQSNDAARFYAISIVTAKGKANNSYAASIAEFNSGIIYYRLKIVDTDGSFAYSSIIKIDRRKNTAGFSILTNPVKDLLTINTTDRILNNTEGSIINSLGAVVKIFVVNQGSQAFDVKGLPIGVYYLRIMNGSYRFIKQ